MNSDFTIPFRLPLLTPYPFSQTAPYSRFETVAPAAEAPPEPGENSFDKDSVIRNGLGGIPTGMNRKVIGIFDKLACIVIKENKR